MAFTASFTAPPKSLLKAMAAKLSALAASAEAAFALAIEREARLDRVARLEALSDADLAAQGLSREAIVAHVFRDRFCY